MPVNQHFDKNHSKKLIDKDLRKLSV